VATRQQINLIRALAAQRGLDPSAVLAVAAQEGLSGGIGDSGTSFGPFQLHKGGALPRNLANPAQWSWSKAGLIYALNAISRVARGRKGSDAIRNIVSRFERPANPEAEIAKALAAYGRPGAGMPRQTSESAPQVAPLNPQGNNTLLQAILAGDTHQGVLDTIRARQAAPPIMPPGGPVSPPNAPPGSMQGFTPAELFYRDMALKMGHKIGAVPNHYDHVHAAYQNPQAVLKAIALARSLGLRVGENPYVGGVAPVHVRNSYHYRTFPKKYNGRRLGEGIDVSGNQAKMLQFYKLLAGGLR
jgi:hypothetical protein